MGWNDGGSCFGRPEAEADDVQADSETEPRCESVRLGINPFNGSVTLWRVKRGISWGLKLTANEAEFVYWRLHERRAAVQAMREAEEVLYGD